MAPEPAAASALGLGGEPGFLLGNCEFIGVALGGFRSLRLKLRLCAVRHDELQLHLVGTADAVVREARVVRQRLAPVGLPQGHRLYRDRE